MNGRARSSEKPNKFETNCTLCFNTEHEVHMYQLKEWSLNLRFHARTVTIAEEGRAIRSTHVFTQRRRIDDDRLSSLTETLHSDEGRLSDRKAWQVPASTQQCTCRSDGISFWGHAQQAEAGGRLRVTFFHDNLRFECKLPTWCIARAQKKKHHENLTNFEAAPQALVCKIKTDKTVFDLAEMQCDRHAH